VRINQPPVAAACGVVLSWFLQPASKYCGREGGLL